MVPLGQGAGKIIDPFNINVGEACSCMYRYSAVGSCEVCLLTSRASVKFSVLPGAPLTAPVTE